MVPTIKQCLICTRPLLLNLTRFSNRSHTHPDSILSLKWLIAPLQCNHHHQIISRFGSHFMTRAPPNSVLKPCPLLPHRPDFLAWIRHEHVRFFPKQAIRWFNDCHRTLPALTQFLVQKQKMSVAWHNIRSTLPMVDDMKAWILRRHRYQRVMLDVTNCHFVSQMAISVDAENHWIECVWNLSDGLFTFTLHVICVCVNRKSVGVREYGSLREVSALPVWLVKVGMSWCICDRTIHICWRWWSFPESDLGKWEVMNVVLTWMLSQLQKVMENCGTFGVV